jgi:hypothetical protein
MGEQERAQQLLDYYYTHRVKNQLDFYDKRTEKLDARDRTLRIVAGLLMIGTTLASIGHIFQDSWSPTLQLLWSLLMLSLLPALSTAFLTLRNIHPVREDNRPLSPVLSGAVRSCEGVWPPSL